MHLTDCNSNRMLYTRTGKKYIIQVKPCKEVGLSYFHYGGNFRNFRLRKMRTTCANGTTRLWRELKFVKPGMNAWKLVAHKSTATDFYFCGDIFLPFLFFFASRTFTEYLIIFRLSENCARPRAPDATKYVIWIISIVRKSHNIEKMCRSDNLLINDNRLFKLHLNNLN